MAKIDPLADYKRCEKCGSTQVYPGGVGSHRTKILCEKCFHIRAGLSFKGVIVPMVAEQYNLSFEEALLREEESQAEYERIVAEAGTF